MAEAPYTIGGPVGGPNFTSGVGASRHASSSIWATGPENRGTLVRVLTEPQRKELISHWDELDAQRSAQIEEEEEAQAGPVEAEQQTPELVLVDTDPNWQVMVQREDRALVAQLGLQQGGTEDEEKEDDHSPVDGAELRRGRHPWTSVPAMWLPLLADRTTPWEASRHYRRRQRRLQREAAARREAAEREAEAEREAAQRRAREEMGEAAQREREREAAHRERAAFQRQARAEMLAAARERAAARDANLRARALRNSLREVDNGAEGAVTEAAEADTWRVRDILARIWGRRRPT